MKKYCKNIVFYKGFWRRCAGVSCTWSPRLLKRLEPQAQALLGKKRFRSRLSRKMKMARVDQRPKSQATTEATEHYLVGTRFRCAGRWFLKPRSRNCDRDVTFHARAETAIGVIVLGPPGPRVWIRGRAVLEIREQGPKRIRPQGAKQ